MSTDMLRRLTNCRLLLLLLLLLLQVNWPKPCVHVIKYSTAWTIPTLKYYRNWNGSTHTAG